MIGTDIFIVSEHFLYLSVLNGAGINQDREWGWQIYYKPEAAYILSFAHFAEPGIRSNAKEHLKLVI